MVYFWCILVNIFFNILIFFSKKVDFEEIFYLKMCENYSIGIGKIKRSFEINFGIFENIFCLKVCENFKVRVGKIKRSFENYDDII